MQPKRSLFRRARDSRAVLSFATFALLAPALGYATTSESDGPSPTAISAQQERYKNLELFQKVLHFIEQNYVDDDKVKNKELIYGAIKGMMETLDPHSNFLTPEI